MPHPEYNASLSGAPDINDPKDMTDKINREPLPLHEGFFYTHNCPGIECWCNDEVVTPYRRKGVNAFISFLENDGDTLQCEDCGETFSSDSLGLRLLDLHRCGKV